MMAWLIALAFGLTQLLAAVPAFANGNDVHGVHGVQGAQGQNIGYAEPAAK